MVRLAGFVFALLFATFVGAPVEARRVALVVGNSSYSAASSLANPAADARLVAASLKRAGFDTVDLKFDLGKSALETALRDFGLKADGADVALIYYAGHGIEAGGQNYLIPTDARLQRDRDLDIEATRLETVMLVTESARLRVVILDACRNNPFLNSMQRTLKTRSVGRGLALVEPEGETLVVYAAKAGATAADGDGANSPFAEALARRLPEPGLEISLLFRAVRDDVLAKTGRTQEPFTYGSLSGQAFYFRPAAPPVASGQSAPPVVVTQEVTETLFWQGAVNANSAAAFRSYLQRYPAGQFSELARENLARFDLLPPAPAAAATSTQAGSSQPPDDGARRGYLGMALQPLDPKLAFALGLSAGAGELVASLVPGGAAERAGVRKGDIVVSVANTDVSATDRAAFIVARQEVGASISLGFLRDGRRQSATAIVGLRPSEEALKALGFPTGLGFSVRLVDQATAQSITNMPKLKFRDDAFGAVISSIDPDAVAKLKGLKIGDLIYSMEYHALGKSGGDFAHWLAEARKRKQKTVLLGVLQDGAYSNVKISID